MNSQIQALAVPKPRAMPRPLLADRYAAGAAWLADCSEHADDVHEAWAAEALAPIVSGERWLVAESRLVTGMPAAMRIREELRGPVLADGELDRAWWLVPDTAADVLADVRQLVVHPAGWSLLCPPMNSYIDNRFWLWRPDGSGVLTDASVIATAFRPGGYRHPAEASA